MLRPARANKGLVIVALASLFGACAVDDADSDGDGASHDSEDGGGNGGGGVSTNGANGVPVDGFPSYEERLMVVAINRTRSDPNNPDAGTADACSEHRDPRPPLLYDHDAGQAARFHCANLGLNGGGLSHATFCELRDDIEATGCDGLADCACVPDTECWSCETLGGCGTNHGGRMTRFGFSGSPGGEVGAAGYGDAWAAVGGWITENPCSSGTLAHRNTLTGGANVVGTGVHRGGACWGAYYFADFGRIDGLSPPPLASAIHLPERAGVGASVVFYANYFDPGSGGSTAGRDPQSVHVAIGSTCVPMEVELGTDGNTTYVASATIEENAADPNGCVEYFVSAYTDNGRLTTYPERGSLVIDTGAGECDDWVERRWSGTCR